MNPAAPPTRSLRVISIALAVSLVAAACGGDSGDSADTTAAPAATTTTTAAAPSPTSSTTAPADTTTTTPVPAETTTTLPGEPIDIGPNSGDVLGVVAVSYDDILNLREGPGTDFEVLKKMPARSDRVIANGRAQALPNSIWYEVTFTGVTGWASSTYLAHVGGVDDITAEILSRFDDVPIAETMADLGLVVAETYPATERPLRVRMSGAPSVGDLGEVIYDVVGFADDSVKGLRLHIFGAPIESGEGFSLMSVEATALCLRGVTDDGSCV